MREWRLHCCEVRFAVGLWSVSLLIGCMQEPPPQLVAPIRVTPRTASPHDDVIAVALPAPRTPTAAVPTSAAPTSAAPTPAAGAALDRLGMVLVPAGRYRPFFPGKDEPEQRFVAAFALDVMPVTVGAYQRFLQATPAWRRGAVPRIFADPDYLRSWRTDLDAGVPANTVLTHVSWFAARAYCLAQGKRLPTVAEWERAALASAVAADGRKDPAFNARILRWYGHPARGRAGPVGRKAANFFGLRDLHGLVWEWVDDFNSALVTGESRADAALERGLYCGAGSIGAADPSDYAAFMRFALRSSLKAAYTTGSLGFRCAADAPKGATP